MYSKTTIVKGFFVSIVFITKALMAGCEVKSRKNVPDLEEIYYIGDDIVMG